MISRFSTEKLIRYIDRFPCVAIVGPRQVGKTTLSKEIIKKIKKKHSVIYLDLELNSDLDKLQNAQYFLSQHEDSLVVIDEVQRMPQLFPLIRALIDKKRKGARFLLLGSAAPDLIRDSSESLAGRIIYCELGPISLLETKQIDKLWLKGGFPEAFLEKDEEFYNVWMNGFVRTYMESDLVQLGFKGNVSKAQKLWSMLAHYHGNIIHYTELAKSLDVSVPTVQSYVEFLEKAFLIRLLPAYSGNLKKRLVKSPKVYIRDSGILHHFLNIKSKNDLLSHPKLGASWEGFVIEQIIAKFGNDYSYSFYRSQDGAEIDFIIEKGAKSLLAIEIKLGADFKISKGNFSACEDIKASKNIVVTKENEKFKLNEKFEVINLMQFLESEM